ncbi:signal peptidase II [Bifidobacterium cebidarum]|uniref:Lipoprotein signal peptidase n=1 Tax=Bifidobacterium cebidarum TaxID=2650773 RepID=A0A6I1G7B3_9BIFI|nr:signal peptidase II [Bifidobacterium cebidarum]KAB7785741.1 lipoprotein signal peptidase [Bifidobacterium cebidarum]
MTNQQGRLRIRAAVFACVAAAALIVDQLTKAWAMAALSDGQTIEVIPKLLSFTLVRNPGASLGMGSGATWVISLLAIAACCALLYCGLLTVSLKWTAVLSLAFAGAFGNLIDRVMYADGFLNGKVVDFLNYGWSVGNVADVYLVVAGVAIVILILLNEPFSTKDLQPQQGDDTDAKVGAE